MNCPDCNSSNLRNKGYGTDGAKRFKCNQCGANFYNRVESEHTSDPHYFNEGKVTGKDILLFGCVHLPHERKGYLDFLVDTQKKYNCDTVVCLGDLIDNGAISFHDRDVEMDSAGREIEQIKAKLIDWVEAFPNLHITTGNHDALNVRRAIAHGIPKALMKSTNDIFGMPDTWKWYDRVLINDHIVAMHGTGKSGANAAVAWMNDNFKSTVIAHLHTQLSCTYKVNRYNRTFAVCSGAGINDASKAFAYNRDHGPRSINGCTVILDAHNPKITQPILVPMPL